MDAETVTVGFLKLLSTHPIHIVLWGKFPFNVYHSICPFFHSGGVVGRMQSDDGTSIPPANG